MCKKKVSFVERIWEEISNVNHNPNNDQPKNKEILANGNRVVIGS